MRTAEFSAIPGPSLIWLARCWEQPRKMRRCPGQCSVAFETCRRGSSPYQWRALFQPPKTLRFHSAMVMAFFCTVFQPRDVKVACTPHRDTVRRMHQFWTQCSRTCRAWTLARDLISSAYGLPATLNWPGALRHVTRPRNGAWRRSRRSGATVYLPYVVGA